MSDTLLTVIWIAYAAILGLLIGSFLNVCIYRLPAKITIVKGHSFCPNCKHPLSMLDLFPVFSYLLLGRKCRYCHEPISSRYMKIELLTGVYFVLAAWFLRPGQVSLPDWLGGIFDISGPMASLEASLILTMAAGLAFSALLVWSMIIWDQHDVPFRLFVLAAAPVIVLLAMQPEQIIMHVLALGLSLLFVLFLVLIKLMPLSSARDHLRFGIGLGLLASMSGLIPSVTIFAICLIVLLSIKILTRQSGSAIEKQAALLWRSLPLQLLLIGSLLWLFT